MRNLRRFPVTILAVLVLPVMGCNKKKIVDTTTTEDPIEVTEGTQDTESTSGESDPADTDGQDADGAGGKDPSSAGGEDRDGEDPGGKAPGVAGSELQAILERLERLESGQRHAHEAWHQNQQALSRAHLLLGAAPDLDDDMLARAEQAQVQLMEAQKGVEGLPNGEALSGMLDLMSQALTQLSGVPGPCPEAGESAEWFESQQRQIDYARNYVRGPPGSPNPKLMLGLLDSAQEELDRAKTEKCAGKTGR